MSELQIGILIIIGLFVLIFLGLPLGVALCLAGFIGLVFTTSFGAAAVKLALNPYTVTCSFVIAVLPLFILMGEMCIVGGLSEEAYSGAHRLLGGLPGGLAMATIGGCTAFAAICSSSGATAVTIGSVALPQMRQYKYSPALGTGAIAAGGTLGILIPPSVGFILYGLITEQSIGKLFIAGILPGILLSFLFMVVIYTWAKVNPQIGPPGAKTSWLERLRALGNMWALLILFLLVMGGIYTGVFTPTEAAAAGTFFAFLVALARRRLTKANLMTAVTNALRTSGMVFILIIGATFFSYFVAVSGLAQLLADSVAGLPFPPLVIMVFIVILFIILGCVMDIFSMILLIVPILHPLLLGLEFDLIWFGVICVLLMEMGLITPPIGMNVFMIAGIAPDVSMYTIFRGIFPFLLAMAVCIALLIAFPQIALFLPTRM